MHAYYTYLALDIARRRAAEADADRLAARGRARSTRTPLIRRLIARGALAVARAADGDLRASLSTR
ncbi:MAG TPA: hypothetical protein VFI34_08330 [Candidatus Limnocylindrales bacterium]|jgi:hypothetical protein|nr:hypothetical protein [Candidatus Limnocylindrales bacterium]